MKGGAMAPNETLLGREEFARRGQEIYENEVRPKLQPSDEDKFVAIDVKSGQFEIDPDDYEATERLLLRVPEAQMWLVRVGQPAAHRIGPRAALGGME